MSEIAAFEHGGYRYIKAVFQYSGGIAAEPGFEIERARFMKPMALADGMAAAKAYLSSLGRPVSAIAAFELRSPAPFTEPQFKEFNETYVGNLEKWGIYKNGINPVARTNVCPEYSRPKVPMVYAFSYTLPTEGSRETFIISGGGEAKEGNKTYRESIVCLGDTSPAGMRSKIKYVMTEMESRLSALGFNWEAAVSTQGYTIHDIGKFIRPEIVERGAASGGFVWHFARPPIVDLEFEMDVRGTVREIVL